MKLKTDTQPVRDHRLLMLEETQRHLQAAIGALNDAKRSARAAKLPYDQIAAAIHRTEIAWAILDPFHGLSDDKSFDEVTR